MDNLQLLCSSCNRIKGNRTMEYPMARLAELRSCERTVFDPADGRALGCLASDRAARAAGDQRRRWYMRPVVAVNVGPVNASGAGGVSGRKAPAGYIEGQYSKCRTDVLDDPTITAAAHKTSTSSLRASQPRRGTLGRRGSGTRSGRELARLRSIAS